LGHAAHAVEKYKNILMSKENLREFDTDGRVILGEC
jgi:hypothetical protein